MTNTRLTDPEILESRYPVLLECVSDSGEAPAVRGVGQEARESIRQIRFREPMSVAILANTRLVPPFGLEGGGPGQSWQDLHPPRRRTGLKNLASCGRAEVKAGDKIVVETPGGGGFGTPTP